MESLYNDSDSRFLKAKLNDMLEISEKNCMPVYSDFLDERQAGFLNAELQKLHCHNFLFFGGYDDAQRKILCVHTPYYIPEPEDFPLNIIQFSYRKADVLTHRDFLGSVMACRIKREKVGDILISKGLAQIFVYDSVSGFLINEITKIGRVGVKASITDRCTIKRIQKYQDIRGTVASMRLDCILSLALRKSREKTVQIIKKDGADINFVTVFSPSVTLKENDVFSVRGFGKFILKNISVPTSKGRFHILIQKFI